MKKIEVVICACLVFLFSITFVISCQKNGDKKKEQEASLTPEAIPRVLQNAKLNDLQLPDGTTTEVIDDGATVRFKFPDGIMLAGVNKVAGDIELLPGGEYTCTGSCTKGCDVLYAGGSFGCSACDPATVVCTGKAKGSFTDLEGRGFININAGISFISEKSQTKGLFTGPSIKVLLSIPQVAEAMKTFNRKVYGTDNPDFSDASQFREVGMNLFGCLVTYMAPARTHAKYANVPPDDELVDGASWSCRCDAPAGSSGCTKDSGIGYKKCESGACVSCTMIVN